MRVKIGEADFRSKVTLHLLGTTSTRTNSDYLSTKARELKSLVSAMPCSDSGMDCKAL